MWSLLLLHQFCAFCFRIKCRVCNQGFKITNGSTSSALRHLRAKHDYLLETKENVKKHDHLLWTFFSKDPKGKTAICNDCNFRLVIEDEKETSFLRDHLRTTHEASFKTFRELLTNTRHVTFMYIIS